MHVIGLSYQHPRARGLADFRFSTVAIEVASNGKPSPALSSSTSLSQNLQCDNLAGLCRKPCGAYAGTLLHSKSTDKHCKV